MAQAWRSLAATEDVLRRSHVRLGRLVQSGRLVADDAKGYWNLYGAYYERRHDVAEVTVAQGVPPSTCEEPVPVPPLVIEGITVPDRVTQSMAQMREELRHRIDVAVPDYAVITNAPSSFCLVNALRGGGRSTLLLKPIADEKGGHNYLVRQAALYDIYLSRRLEEEGIKEGPEFLASMTPEARAAAFRVGGAVMRTVGVMIFQWFGSRAGRNLDALAEAVEAAEGSGQ